MTQTGYFRVLSYNEETGDLELGENGLDEPDAEIVYGEWHDINSCAEEMFGRIFFRDRWVEVPELAMKVKVHCTEVEMDRIWTGAGLPVPRNMVPRAIQMRV